MHGIPELAQPRHAGPFPALLLNADHRPLSTFPLSVLSWHDACRAVVTDDVDVVREHETLCRSARMSFRMPSVVALRQYVHVKRTPAFTRENMLLRDMSSCAYCGHRFASHDLTYDHVIPKAIGGKKTWTNIVMACNDRVEGGRHIRGCNGLKACRTPEQAKMPLQWRPWQPTNNELAKVAMRFRKQKLHEHWLDYLPDLAEAA